MEKEEEVGKGCLEQKFAGEKARVQGDDDFSLAHCRDS